MCVQVELGYCRFAWLVCGLIGLWLRWFFVIYLVGELFFVLEFVAVTTVENSVAEFSIESTGLDQTND